MIHVVQPEDTLASVAKKYNTSVQKITEDNSLGSERLVVGQALVLPSNEHTYTVRRGDSLYSIAKKAGVPLKSLQAANPGIRPPYRLQPGMRLRLPEENKKSILVNGYAFPQKNITFQDALPYLTYLSIFSHHTHPDGTLIPIDDAGLIREARANHVAPMMVVTNMDANGGFNSSLAHTLLTDQDIHSNYIDNILHTLRSKNYFGLDIDFEYVYPGDRDAYNRFVSRMARLLGERKVTLTTALAPKTHAEQQGLLYTAHDYAHHGEQADHIILMTYEWGYTKGPAMAVSPMSEVKTVLQYATSVIPANKILLGIPNYGYDWTLPFVRGTSARSLSNTEAVELAADTGASIEYDGASQAPYFHYEDNGRRHEVWFEDARSIQASLKLAGQFGLGGVSYWTMGRPFPQNWLILRSMYRTKKLL